MVPSLRSKLNQQYASTFIPRDTDLGKAVASLSQKIDWEKANKLKCVEDLRSLIVEAESAGVDGATVVGQTVFALFSPDELKIMESVPGDRPSTFTNGGDVYFSHKTRQVVETPHEKEVNMQIHPYRPSVGMIGLGLILFAKRRKKSYFRDSMYACSVFSKELDITLGTFLKLRGWKGCVVGGDVRVSYVRIEDCLFEIGEEKAAAYFRASTMMESLFRVLHSDELFPSAGPSLDYEKFKRECTSKCAATNRDDGILSRPRKVAVETLDDGDERKRKPRDGGDQPPAKRQRKVAAIVSQSSTDSCNQSSVDSCDEDEESSDNSEQDSDEDYVDMGYDSDDEESIAQATTKRKGNRDIAAPSTDGNPVSRFYRRLSSWCNLVDRQKILQIAWRTLELCFRYVIHVNYIKDEELFEKLFTLVFAECSSRRMLLETCQDLLMFCWSEDTIKENKETLLGWITDDPTTIRQRVGARSKSISTSDYERQLKEQLKIYFFRSHANMDNRNWTAQHTLVRLAVSMELQKMEKSRKVPSALTSYRRTQTVVERKIAERSTTSHFEAPPPHTVATLRAVSSLYDQAKRIEVACRTDTDTDKVARVHAGVAKEDTAASIVLAVLGKRPHRAPVANPIGCQDRPFDGVRVATVGETRAICHRLVVKREQDNVLLYHAPVEVYLARKLSVYPHQYENHGTKNLPAFQRGDLPLLVIGDQCAKAQVGCDIMVARPTSAIFKDHFPKEGDEYKGIDILCDFVYRKGKQQKKRSKGGYRLDIMNGGRAYELSQDGDKYKPRGLCGDGVFEDKDVDGPLVRSVVGRLLDALCPLGKAMAGAMGLPTTINQQRYDEYALLLAKFFYSKSSDVEFVTIQLLNLSRGDGGELHKDELNDNRPSYDRVVVKVINLVDKVGDLWSLKLVTGFRRCIGDYYTTRSSAVLKIMLAANTYLRSVDQAYLRWAEGHLYGYQGDDIPSWRSYDKIALTDLCPWDNEDGSFSLITGVCRGYWMSVALSDIEQLCRAHRLPLAGVYQLIIVLAWQNTFTKFHQVCQKMLSEGGYDRHYPIFGYYKAATKLFGVMPHSAQMYGGDAPRFGTVAIDFASVFGTDADPKKEEVNKVVEDLMRMADSVNAQSEPTMNSVSFLLKETSRTMRVRCQLGSFRLMLSLQAMAYLGVGLVARPQLRRFFVPLKGSGGHDHMLLAGIAEEDMPLLLEEMLERLSTRGREVKMDELENILCESRDGRLCVKYDVFYKGQSLFMLSGEGPPLVKYYNTNEWVTLTLL